MNIVSTVIEQGDGAHRSVAGEECAYLGGNFLEFLLGQEWCLCSA
jgi:hypothetical protein